MAQYSSIEWTDRTWNPTRGCDKISPGCSHCDAALFAHRFEGVKGNAYELGFMPRIVPEKIDRSPVNRQTERVFRELDE